MQRKIEINRLQRPAYASPGDKLRLYLRPNATLFADVGQVRGETVAGINHGGCQASLAQHASQFDSRIREKMAGKLARIRLLNCDSYPSASSRLQRSNHPIPHSHRSGRPAALQSAKRLSLWARLPPQQCRPEFHRATPPYRRRQASHRIAPPGEQTAGKMVNPSRRNIAWQSQRKKYCDRLAAHGGNVAQSPRQAPVADRFRRMPVAPEVNAFQREVGRNQCVYWFP